MAYIKLKFYSEVDGQKAWTSECSRAWFNDRLGQEVRTSWKDEVLGPKQGKGKDCTLRRFKFTKIERSMFSSPGLNVPVTSLQFLHQIAKKMS
jgi:hypothetical protein